MANRYDGYSNEQLIQEVRVLNGEVHKGNRVIQALQTKIGSLEGRITILDVEKQDLEGYAQHLYNELNVNVGQAPEADNVEEGEGEDGQNEEVGE